jgi:hypothetical protein
MIIIVATLSLLLPITAQALQVSLNQKPEVRVARFEDNIRHSTEDGREALFKELIAFKKYT